MIDIRNAAGLVLELAPATRLTTERLLGWLSDDDWPGGYSYPLKFPLTDANQRFLGLSHRPGQLTPGSRMPVTLELGGLISRQCELLYRLAGGAGEGTLLLDGGTVFSKLKNLTVAEAIGKAALPDAGVLAGGNRLAELMLRYAQAEPGRYACTFFPIRNDRFYETEAIDGRITGFRPQPYVNPWTNGKFLTDGIIGSTISPSQWPWQDPIYTPIWQRGLTVSPQFYLTWVLEQICASIGYKLGGDWPYRPDVRRRVLLNQTACDQTGTGFLLLLTAIYPYRHMPDVTVGELFKILRLRFGLLIDFDATTRTCVMRQFTDVVGDEAALDLTPYRIGQMDIEPAEPNGLTVTEAWDEADELYKKVGRDGRLETPPLRSYSIGAGDGSDRKTVALGSAPVQQTWEPTPDGTGRWVVPCVAQRGNHLDANYKASEVGPTDDGQLKQKTSVRFLDYYGLQPDSRGRLYPLAVSAHAIDGRQQPLPGAAGLSVATELSQGPLGRYFTARADGRVLTLPLKLPLSTLGALSGRTPLRLSDDEQGLFRVLLTRLRQESPGPDGLCPTSAEVLELPSRQLATDVAPPVWVELHSLSQIMPLSPVLSESPPADVFSYRNIGRRVRLTVRCFYDAARTRPAPVAGLTVYLRVRREHATRTDEPAYTPAQRYENTLRAYTVSGASTVIELGMVMDQLYNYAETGHNHLVWFLSSWQLDLGEGYTLLPPVYEIKNVEGPYVYDPNVLGPTP